MKRWRIALSRAAGLLMCLLATGIVRGQDPRGAIIGRVTDRTGAVVPGARVTVVHDATQVKLSTASNEAGNFSIPFVSPGVYTVSAEATGFKRTSRSGVQLRVGDVAEVNIVLEIGELTETVEVTSEAPLLETASATLGHVVSERQITELPLYAGNVTQELTILAPGMVNPIPIISPNYAPWNNFRAQSSGNPDRSNDFSIDGVPNTFPNRGGNGVRPAFNPPTTAITEFKIQTAFYDASVGHSMGASVNVATKSGTNELRGGAHWFHKNSALAAPTFFENRIGARKAVWRYNRFGLDIGGPVRLPGYDGRNKTFFFYTYEGNLWAIPEPRTDTVPTAAQRTGDFSALLALGSRYQIYDPFSAVPQPGGRLLRQPFPNNLVPRSLMDPVGVNMVQLYPMPNQPGTADGLNNYFTPAVASQDYGAHVGRVDHVISANSRLFVRFHADDWLEDQLRRLGPNNPASGVKTGARNKGGALDYVRVLSPTMVFNLRYGITYQIRDDYRVSRGWDLKAFGFSDRLVSLIDGRFATIPDTAMRTYARISRFWDGDGAETGLTHTANVNLTRIHGEHNLKFGFSFRGYRSFGNRFPYSTSPFFRFTGVFSRGPLDNSPNSPHGQDLADLLLGLPADGYMELTPSYAMNGPAAGLYIHDDFKLTRKLTLNLGLRWEYDFPVTERFNRLVASFDAGSPNPIEGPARANYVRNPIPELAPADFRVLGGLTWVNQGGRGRSPFRTEKNNFMPRIGLAYQVTDKTILRAGYGLFYETVGVNRSEPIQTGYAQSTPIQVTLDGGQTFVTRMSDPLPAGLLPPKGPAGGLTTNLNQSLTFYPARRLTPYAQRWSFGVQQLLPADIVLEAGYVGNRGTRLEVARELNATPAKWLSKEFFRDQKTIDFLSERLPSPFRGTDPIFGSTITRAELLRPFPHFRGVVFNDPVGYSWYHSLQVRAEKRFSQGLAVQLSYTWSKLMQATEFLNPSDAMPYETLAATDRPHVVALTGLWDLPWGRGRRFGSQMPAIVNGVLGGWQLGVVGRYQSGQPLEFGDAIFVGNVKEIALPKGQRTVDRWFNTGAGFVRDPAQQRAYNLRSFPLRFGGVRGPSQQRWDLSARKNFEITETVRLEFRAEAINALNSAIFLPPNTTPTSSAFGRVTGVAWQGREWQLGLRARF